jgi:hypothetical protein
VAMIESLIVRRHHADDAVTIPTKALPATAGRALLISASPSSTVTPSSHVQRRTTPARRHDHQGASPRTRPASQHKSRSKPGTRRATRIPSTDFDPETDPGLFRPHHRLSPADQHRHATVGIIRWSA